MRYATLCSGIEAPSVAWPDWSPVFFSEIEPFPCAALKHHYPSVPNYGDMTKFKEWPHHAIDLIIAGTPCQSFSVAGLRKGLDDPRGNLTLTYLAVIDKYRPRWVVWENVPGVLSSVSHDAPDPCEPPPPMDMGRKRQEVETTDEYDSEELHAFNCFLAGLSELGYGWSYRIHDAQFAGVPQRRRRVFVVGHLGDWHPAAAVLLERHGLQGHTAPSREKGKDIAGTLESRASGGGGGPAASTDGACAGYLQPVTAFAQNTRDEVREISGNIAGALPAQPGMKQQTYLAQAFNIQHNDGGQHKRKDRPNGGLYVKETDTALTVGTTDMTAVAQVAWALQERDSKGPVSDTKEGHLIPVCVRMREGCAGGGKGPLVSEDKSLTLASGNDQTLIAPSLTASNDPSRSPQSQEVTQQVNAVYRSSMQVRRLTPTECERLQGFPDGYTNIPWRGKDTSPDGPRYKALGNSMAVPVIAWIGKRIEMVNEVLQ